MIALLVIQSIAIHLAPSVDADVPCRYRTSTPRARTTPTSSLLKAGGSARCADASRGCRSRDRMCHDAAVAPHQVTPKLEARLDVLMCHPVIDARLPT